MEKDKSLNIGGSLLPPSGRMHSIGSNNFGVRPEASGSTASPPMVPGPSSDINHFSNDISRMPDNPPKHSGHRRAQSEILTLPDDISFDSDLGVVGGFNGPSFSDETEEDLFYMYLDIDKFNSSSASASFQVGDLSEGVIRQDENANVVERPRVRHQHSQSMDGSEEMSPADAKKSMSAAKLAELALVDPKRAKRIWANRQSAARSKERKMRYIGELEKKVQTLQTEATSRSSQLTLMQRDTSGLTADNSELKLHLQTMERQVHLQDALNEALKEEIQHLKVLIGQNLANGGPLMNFNPSLFGSKQRQFYPNSNNSSQQESRNTLFTAQQFQQLQIQSQKQQHDFQQQQQLRQFQHQQQQQEQQSSDLN